MTVEELIRKLERLPDWDMKVFIRSGLSEVPVELVLVDDYYTDNWGDIKNTVYICSEE